MEFFQFFLAIDPLNKSRCYVINVSLIKTSVMQSRKQEFEILQLNKSLMKNSNFSVSAKKGSEDVIID